MNVKPSLHEVHKVAYCVSCLFFCVFAYLVSISIGGSLVFHYHYCLVLMICTESEEYKLILILINQVETLPLIKYIGL
jgi:Pyruvate/2-oxoacid:ferredoxin oxidoreductase delta subunit